MQQCAASFVEDLMVAFGDYSYYRRTSARAIQQAKALRRWPCTCIFIGDDIRDLILEARDSRRKARRKKHDMDELIKEIRARADPAVEHMYRAMLSFENSIREDPSITATRRP